MASAALYTAITPPTQDTPKAGVIMSLVKSPQMKARCKPMYRKINISSSIFFSNRSENPLFTKERLQMTELTESLCSKGCSDVHIWSCGLKRQANTVPTAILPRNTMKSCTIPGVVMLGSTDELFANCNKASVMRLPITWLDANTLQNCPLKFPIAVASVMLHTAAWLFAAKVK